MRLSAVLTVLIVCSSTLMTAQSSSPTHNHTPSQVIDGAVHPELIPDSTAYRLYFVMVSKPPSPTDEQMRRQSAQLAKVGLTESDKKTATAILAGFYSQYHALLANYNEQATAAWTKGEKIDQTAFLLQRDQLVQSTHDAMMNTLTQGGWARLDGYVQNEKRKMKIHSQEAGQ